MSEELTPMQRRFCLEYVKDPKRNKTKAAIRAGSEKRSAHVTASRWLRLAKVRQFIRTLVAEDEAEILLKTRRVIKELSRIAFFDASIFQEIASGQLKLSDLTADERAAVAEYTESDTQFGKTIKIKAHNKIKALEVLAQHLGILNPEPPDEQDEVYLRPESMR